MVVCRRDGGDEEGWGKVVELRVGLAEIRGRLVDVG